MTKVLGDVTAQVITDQISVPASQAQHMLHLASGRYEAADRCSLT